MRQLLLLTFEQQGIRALRLPPGFAQPANKIARQTVWVDNKAFKGDLWSLNQMNHEERTPIPQEMEHYPAITHYLLCGHTVYPSAVGQSTCNSRSGHTAGHQRNTAQGLL
jgi:hypothetical protein